MEKLTDFAKSVIKRMATIVELKKIFPKIRIRMKGTVHQIYKLYEKKDYNKMYKRLNEADPEGMGAEWFIGHANYKNVEVIADIRFENSPIEAHIPYPPGAETQEEKELTEAEVKIYCEDRYMIIFKLNKKGIPVAFVQLSYSAFLEQKNLGWRQRRSNNKWKPSIQFVRIDESGKKVALTADYFKFISLTEKDPYCVVESPVRKNETFEEFVLRVLEEKKARTEKN